MKVITLKRVVRHPHRKTRGRFSDIGLAFFYHESRWHLIVDAVLFALISIASAWPLYAAADAVNRFL